MEMTQEQEDALVLKELGITEENSISNDTTEEEEVEEATESEETEVETEEEVEETEEEVETEKKPKNKFAKLLSERNEARKQAEAEAEEKAKALSKVDELNEKLKSFEEGGDNTSKDYIETLVEKRLAEQNELTDFFDEYEELKEYKKDILNTKNELNIPLEQATKLYLAEHNPALLLSPQAKAKNNSKILNAPTRASKKLITGEFDYSDEEFDKLAREGKIKF